MTDQLQIPRLTRVHFFSTESGLPDYRGPNGSYSKAKCCLPYTYKRRVFSTLNLFYLINRATDQHSSKSSWDRCQCDSATGHATCRLGISLSPLCKNLSKGLVVFHKGLGIFCVRDAKRRPLCHSRNGTDGPSSPHHHSGVAPTYSNNYWLHNCNKHNSCFCRMLIDCTKKQAASKSLSFTDTTGHCTFFPGLLLFLTLRLFTSCV